ncbi:MAG: hypothetical protein Q7T11_07950, partial [Deltaproteobacteria bacterium]|nr:hypothetical protein [Deltaproteobacteria bacterium]
LLERSKAINYFVATEKDNILGIGGYNQTKLQTFFVDPRHQKKGIENILLIRGDARIVIPRFFSEGTFEKIFVLYPDPWPKDRHAFRRLLNEEMLALLAHHLKKGGELVFATDVKNYAEGVLQNAGRIPSIQKKEIFPKSSFPLERAKPTFFEDKWVAEGKGIHYLWFVKS